ncbi:hypothetical protein [Bartonella sp. DGB1]|uniref:hypothetical protein n=1 Tax=Bartonella sp. DGB1 TaxID=3239807 RepID=UPI0035267103
MLDSNFKFCHNPFFIWGDQFRQQLYNMLEAIEKLINKSTNQPANNIFNIKNWEHISENDYYLNNISFSEGKIFEKI